jgi:hypothetical protein
MAGKLLGAQQNEVVEYDKAWDYYFPYTIENKSAIKRMRIKKILPLLDF